MKNKTTTDTSHNVLQKQSKATEEQIRVAKLSQINVKEDSHDDKMKQVSDITQKPLDTVSIALHDCNYDTQLAIQNIFEGKYDDQDDWQTTSTKKGKKSNQTTASESSNDKIDTIDGDEQKPVTHKSSQSRGGGTSNHKARSTSRNKKPDNKNTQEDNWDIDQDKSDKLRGVSDRGRSRGRGRGGMRGGGRGGRGSFARGGGAPRGGRQVGRGGGRGSRRPPRDLKRDENGFGEGTGFGMPSSRGFGEPAKEESWGLEEKTEDLGDEAIDEKKVDTDWSKESWGDQEVPEIAPKEADDIFTQKTGWSHVNGINNENKWEDVDSSPSKNDITKYVPEQIDTAVICSIPTSSTSAESTSYQPTNDISRYITNTAPSNQFPSSQQEGGLTSSLNERDYSSLTDSLNQNISSMPMISGITESHKLEQEQRNSKAVQKTQKNRKVPGKNVSMPNMPVVMPRSAQMHHDVGEQFAGLEFGSEPVSPRLLKGSNTTLSFTSDLSNTESLESSLTRQPVANLQDKNVVSLPPNSSQKQQQEMLPHSLMSKPVNVATQIESKKLQSDPITTDISSSLSGFKSLDVGQKEAKPPHYLGSPGRGLGHTMATEPIPFPSSTNMPSSPTSTSASLDVFSRHNVLGTSVTMSVEPQQNLSKYHDKQVYNSHDQNINAEKILAEQKALAEKQYMAEQQRVIAEQHQRETRTEQRAFAEQKALAQQKLLARSKDESENIPSNLKDSRKNVPDTRLGLPDNSGIQTKDSPSKTSSNDTNYSNKSRPTNPRSISSPPGLSSSSVYATKTTNELLNQASSAGSTSKTQSKTSNAPPGMMHPNLLYTAGVQAGMLPYQQLHGYNYDELLQLQRHMHVAQPSPYHYDISTMYPANGPTSREGIANYQGGDSKFARASEDSNPQNLHQANAHVAAGNMSAHQAYLNAGQIPYGFTYAYQPGVMPQAGLYPAFTAAPSMFQLNQAKGVVGTQYAQQQQQQQTYNTTKYSGAGSHDFSKLNFHNNNGSQPTLSKGVSQGVSSSSDGSTGTSSYKGQTYNDKGFLGTSPSSQPTMTIHGQAAHINNINPFVLAQQQQPHTNLLTGQVNANQMGHQGNHDNRSGGHQVSFSGNQQKRDVKGNTYQSYWSGSR